MLGRSRTSLYDATIWCLLTALHMFSKLQHTSAGDSSYQNTIYYYNQETTLLMNTVRIIPANIDLLSIDGQQTGVDSSL
jgi:hypothetical protein